MDRRGGHGFVMSRALRVALAAFGAANVIAAAVFVVTKPERWSDVVGPWIWMRSWLVRAIDSYTDPEMLPAYPPNAIVTFLPLALITREIVVVAVSAAISGAALLLLPWLVVRSGGTPSRISTGLVTSCFLCWSSTRVLVQLTPITMAFAFVAVLLADTRPVSSGIWLGLACAKPHIAAPAALWMLLTRRWRVTLAAAATVVAAFLVYCARVGTMPASTAAAYWRIVVTDFAGPEGNNGLTSVRAWIAAIAPDPSRTDTVWAFTAAVVFVVPVAMAIARPVAASGDGRLAILGSLGAWSLLVLYSNGHNLVVLLPAFVFLLALTDERTRVERIAAAAALQLAMMFDVPLRRAGFSGFDRLATLALFCYLPLLWWRIERYDTSRESRDPRRGCRVA
jgi:hypothetical protein